MRLTRLTVLTTLALALLAAPLAAEGHRYLEGRRTIGRLVLLP
jgi:hypothetical protein